MKQIIEREKQIFNSPVRKTAHIQPFLCSLMNPSRLLYEYVRGKVVIDITLCDLYIITMRG